MWPTYPTCTATVTFTLVLQYGTSPYVPTASASGVVSSSTAGFAKLSDAEINAIEDDDVTYDYYMLTSETATASTQGTLEGRDFSRRS